MNTLRTLSVAAAVCSSAAALAGPVVSLSANDSYSGLSGIHNREFSELIGVTLSDKYLDFSIYDSGSSLLFEGTLMTRVVRSYQSGNLHFNYRILNANSELSGQISHIEVGGFGNFQTRVEYRDDPISTGDEGPLVANRSASGDIIDFGFSGGLSANEESHYFFAMLNTDTYYEDSALATIYLDSGESISLVVDSATPAPGGLALLGASGLLAGRRRRR